jgi:integration host factor subunit alpha
MSLTKRDIANTLAKNIEISHIQALALVNSFFDEIKQSLGSGEDVKLSGFGNFVIKKKTARPGRNPRTGEEVEVSARTVVVFKAGPKLKKLTQSA